MSRRSTKPDKTVSQRELARALGINHSAIKRGIDSGRLAASLTYVRGKPVIKNLQLAIEEWNAGRRPRIDVGTDAQPAAPLVDSRGTVVPDYRVSRAKREAHLAEIAEAEARKLTGGAWLPVSEFEALAKRYHEYFRFCVLFLRNKLPHAIAARCGTSDRMKLHQVQLAADDVCNELASIEASKLSDTERMNLLMHSTKETE